MNSVISQSMCAENYLYPPEGGKLNYSRVVLMVRGLRFLKGPLHYTLLNRRIRALVIRKVEYDAYRKKQ